MSLGWDLGGLLAWVFMMLRKLLLKEIKALEPAVGEFGQDSVNKLLETLKTIVVLFGGDQESICVEQLELLLQRLLVILHSI